MTHPVLSAAAHRFAASMTAAVMTVAAMPAFAQEETAEAEGAATSAVSADAIVGQPHAWGMDLQQAVTPMKEKMHFFHTELLLPIITAICLLVLGLLLVLVVKFRASKNPTASRTTHNTMLEVVWTLVPVIILVAIVIPSMKMLYYVDRAKNPEMTLKVIGYQWYWGYEYPDHGVGEFSANMLKDEELKEGQPRLLATDNEVVLPVDTDIRILITANDVIHSWAVPAFGIKTDAVPGRTNETWVRIEREGTYYGQCSEICGTNHAFMPIQVRAVSKDAFAAWVASQGGQMPTASNDDAPVAGEAAATEPATEETGAAAGEDTPAAAESPATEQ